MTFVKGTSGNPSGKPPGAKHGRTKAWEALGDMFTDEWPDDIRAILNEWKENDPEKFLKYVGIFIEYFKPKQARIENVGDPKGDITVVFSPITVVDNKDAKDG